MRWIGMRDGCIDVRGVRFRGRVVSTTGSVRCVGRDIQ